MAAAIVLFIILIIAWRKVAAWFFTLIFVCLIFYTINLVITGMSNISDFFTSDNAISDHFPKNMSQEPRLVLRTMMDVKSGKIHVHYVLDNQTNNEVQSYQIGCDVIMTDWSDVIIEAQFDSPIQIGYQRTGEFISNTTHGNHKINSFMCDVYPIG